MGQFACNRHNEPGTRGGHSGVDRHLLLYPPGEGTNNQGSCPSSRVEYLGGGEWTPLTQSPSASCISDSCAFSQKVGFSQLEHIAFYFS